MRKLDPEDQSKRMRRFDVLICIWALVTILVISLLPKPAHNPIPQTGTEITEEAGK
jgi:hypothetical protein